MNQCEGCSHELIPGIRFAVRSDGRRAIERCDTCMRFRSDDAAFDRVQRIILDCVWSLADMIIDGDIIDGVEYVADGNDDEIDALYAHVHGARELLGRDDPKGI